MKTYKMSYTAFNHCCPLLAPSGPTSVEVIVVSSSQLNITWQPPSEPNGVIIGYDITWRMTKNDSDESVNGVLNRIPSLLAASRRMYTIKQLGNYWRF